MIHVIEGGLVYRNPKPYLTSRHAWHPSVVQLPGGQLLASFDLAEAVESLDYATFISRSRDGGDTWSSPERLSFHPWLERVEGPNGCPCSHSVRISRLRDGSIVGLGGRWHRKDTSEGIINRNNLGYVPMDLFLIHSQTSGWTWTAPRRIDPPLVGPSFEICHRIIELTDGRWLAPTSTWKGWDGSAPNGMQAIALVSHDRGVTWPDYIPISNEYQRGVITWEVGLAELAGGKLAATLWRFDERQEVSLSSRFTVAEDGQRFIPPVDNGLQGETSKLTALADGRVLCLYRRLDRPGLWAELARIEGPRWIRECEAAVWQGPKSGLLGRTNSSDELSSLKFGYPSAIQLPDGDVLALFWCVEDSLHVIRWMRLRID